MNKVNSEMLVLGREVVGVTQVGLAQAVSVNQATISRYESGQIGVPLNHLILIAEYLERPLSFFYWDERLYSASCMYHRKNRKLSAAELRIIHAKVNLLRVQAAKLLKQAKVTSSYSFHRLDPAKYGGPEGCARELRQLWQLPVGPVRGVVRSIERAGGMVFRCPFGESRVDGISQWALDTPAMLPVFFVHEDIPGDRGRLTLAHEVGHVVMHHLPSEGDPEEEANRFAAEFLMPAAQIAGDLRNMTLPKAAAMKSYWRVSMQSLIYRAKQLGSISGEKYTSLFRSLSAKGYRKCEPAPVAPEEPEMFRAVLDYHRATLKMSERELGEMLGESEANFRLYYGKKYPSLRLVV